MSSETGGKESGNINLKILGGRALWTANMFNAYSFVTRDGTALWYQYTQQS